MNGKNLLVFSTVLATFSTAQVIAHHSFLAEFDPASPIELEGTVLKVAWTNPHTYFYIEVETENGDFQEWALEMGSPNGLARRGWRRDTLKIGDFVTVTGSQARDGKAKANAETVVLDSGERLFAGTSRPDFEEDSN